VFGAPVIRDEEFAEVADTLRSGWIGFGPKCLRFEGEFSRYVGCRHAISLSSGTAGLHLAVVVSGIGPGDEVITTPLTFAATANAIEHVGARPVFVDVDRRSQNIDPEQIARAITPRTKAIIAVHMAGRPCAMGEIHEMAARQGLVVIEDAAHALEAFWQGQKVGNISKFTVFSFYATKNVTTAEGGMLTTSDDEMAERLRTLRLHGMTGDAWKRYSGDHLEASDVVEAGFKYNLTDLQASLGLHQLRRVEHNLGIREQLWGTYDAGLQDLDAIETPSPVSAKDRHARHLYTILLRHERLRIDRHAFRSAIDAEGIGTGVHFVPLHLHTYYQRRYGYRRGDFPVAEDIGARTVSLPLSAGLTEADACRVVEAVRRVVGDHGR
jgi:dTDP-4-amino-4,6-dideoxygalactose transaminase